MVTVKTEVYAPVRFPAQLVVWKKLTLHRVDHREIPVEDVNIELAPLPGQLIEQRPEHFGIVMLIAVTNKAEFAVNVPTNDEDRAVCAEKRLTNSTKVVFAVDHKGHAISMG